MTETTYYAYTLRGKRYFEGRACMARDISGIWHDLSENDYERLVQSIEIELSNGNKEIWFFTQYTLGSYWKWLDNKFDSYKEKSELIKAIYYNYDGSIRISDIFYQK